MNIYEDESLEQKLEELSDQVGHLVLDLLLVSLKKLVKENVIFSEMAEARLDASGKDQPF